MNRVYKALLFPILSGIPFVFAVTNCAKEVTPMGGPKDTLSPEFVKSRPINSSANVSPKKIMVKFNERIELENVSENCIITPSFDETPKISCKNKKMFINLKKSTIKDSITYTFNFVDAIKDLNEGNKLEQFTYAFSKSNTLDTLQVSGKVNTENIDFEKTKVLMLLYSNLADSAFYTSEPMYICSAMKNGEFLFKNVSAGTYRLYALVDADDNKIYSDPVELIGFYDSLIVPKAYNVTDTIKVKNKIARTDSIVADSILQDTFRLQTKTVFEPNSIEISMFKNPAKDFTIRSKERISPLAYSLGFSQEIDTNSLKIKFDDFTKDSYSVEYLSSNDSILVWFTDTSLVFTDSTAFYATHKKGDVNQTDTIIVSPTKELANRFSILSEKFPEFVFPKDSLIITFSRPIGKTNSNIEVYRQTDTSGYANSFGKLYEINPDSLENIPQKYPAQKTFIAKNFYIEQTLINHKLGAHRFALYFAKDINIKDVKISLEVIPQIKGWYHTEYDLETNSLLFWITSEDVMKYKNPVLKVRFKNGNKETEKRVSFSDFVAPEEKFRNVRISRMIADISKSQVENLFLDNTIEIIWNNPVKSFTDSLFTLYEFGDSLMKNVITKIEKNPKENRRLEIYYEAQTAKQYVLEINKDAVVDTYDRTNRAFDQQISTQTKTTVKRYEKVPSTVSQISDRELKIQAELLPKEKYVIIAKKASVQDFYGDLLDSTCIEFSCLESENYGTLSLQIDSLQQPIVLKLKNKDEKKKTIIPDKSLKNSGLVTFANIEPGEYILTCVYDRNANGKEDTGNIYEKRQPENSVTYPNAITIKANWENKLDWVIPEN